LVTGALSFGSVCWLLHWYRPTGRIAPMVVPAAVTLQMVAAGIVVLLAFRWALAAAFCSVRFPTPGIGLITGGTTVTVSGRGFVPGATTVYLGPVPVTQVEVVNSHTLRVISPPAVQLASAATDLSSLHGLRARSR
jgi:hypothetical protein